MLINIESCCLLTGTFVSREQQFDCSWWWWRWSQLTAIRPKIVRLASGERGAGTSGNGPGRSNITKHYHLVTSTLILDALCSSAVCKYAGWSSRQPPAGFIPNPNPLHSTRCSGAVMAGGHSSQPSSRGKPRRNPCLLSPARYKNTRISAMNDAFLLQMIDIDI